MATFAFDPEAAATYLQAAQNVSGELASAAATLSAALPSEAAALGLGTIANEFAAELLSVLTGHLGALQGAGADVGSYADGLRRYDTATGDVDGTTAEGLTRAGSEMQA
ncbi:hypothetical protein ACFVVM_32485 [Nocardia sp. NPDC058176]|uniref:hypothetical protein n=1 Tax=Nocardia sp. NPDC058176 TaxID=3346368 RepID=UPI0036DD6529